MDSNDKKKQTEWFNLNKTVLNTIQGDQFLYIDSQV